MEQGYMKAIRAEDAKQQARNQAIYSQCAQQANTASDRPEGELESLTIRVNNMVIRMNELAAVLGKHADGVHGASPSGGAEEKATLDRSCKLGALHDALDRLERAHNDVTEQAYRNCTLA